MSADARAILPMIWLLASEDDDPLSGIVKYSYEKISFRLRLRTNIVTAAINEMIANGFIEQLQSCNESVTDALQNRTQTVTPETETETEKRQSKNKYGQFNNVSLTDDECQKLIDKFGNDIALAKIENLSSYIASKGVRYKSHYATILTWAQNDAATPNRAKTFADIKEERAREEMRKFVEGE
jgi:hypothetical protein